MTVHVFTDENYFHLLTGFERNFVKLNNSVCVNGKKRECEPIHL